MRVDMYDTFSATLSRTGKTTPAEGAVIANFVNIATGRGDIGRYQTASNALATVFFAPRFAVSRFQLLLGQPMWKGTAGTRLLIAKEYARTLMGLGTFYAAAKLAFGDDTRFEWDSRSADFGKIIFKDGTRIDPLSGLSQVTVLASRLFTGKSKSGTGEIVPIRGEGIPFNSANTQDVITRFLRGKLSPGVGAGVDIIAGKNVVGEPVTPGRVAARMTIPLSFNDIYDVMRKDNIPRSVALSMLIILGTGAQNYQNARPDMFAKKIAEHPKLQGFSKQTHESYDYSTMVNQVIAQSKKNGLSYEDMASALDQKLRAEGVGYEARAEWRQRLRRRLK
jgi:hypothetical protein